MPEITLYINERDPWSGHEERRARTFSVSVGEAESIISSLLRKIPAEKEKNERECIEKIAALEKELALLKR